MWHSLVCSCSSSPYSASVKVSVTSTAKLGFTPRWSSHPACKGFNACNPTFYFTGIKSFKCKKVKLLNQPGYIIKLRQQIVSGHIWSCPHRFTHSWGGHMTWSTKTKTLPEAHVPLAMFCAHPCYWVCNWSYLIGGKFDQENILFPVKSSLNQKF